MILSINITTHCSLLLSEFIMTEPHYEKINNVAAHQKNSDQPRHDLSLIRLFAVRMRKA